MRIGSISSGKRRPTRTARCPHQGFRPLFRKARARCAARGDAKRASRRSIGVVHTYSLPRSGKLGAGFGANGAIGRKKAVNYAGVAIHRIGHLNQGLAIGQAHRRQAARTTAASRHTVAGDIGQLLRAAAGSVHVTVARLAALVRQCQGDHRVPQVLRRYRAARQWPTASAKAGMGGWQRHGRNPDHRHCQRLGPATTMGRRWPR